MNRRAWNSMAAFALAGLLGATGCGVTSQGTIPGKAETAAIVGRAINGNVHGGVFPIQNAYIHLMETQSNGYGGAAKDLLQPLGITVQSDQNGNFNIPDSTWSCDSGQFAYITVTGGYTTNLRVVTVNNSVVQVGVIGPCSDLATSASGDAINRDTINVFVSELSTVAAAYALGNFIKIDSTNAASAQQVVNISAPANNNSVTPGCSGTGAGMSCTVAGLAHGFTNAVNLVDSVRTDSSFPTGQARAVNPANASSVMPQALINTIGNILQTCVDSAGGSQCGSLFSFTTPPNGSAPKNTLQAAMNMAKYPTNNVASLYGITPQQTFFTPSLSGAPISLAVSIVHGVNETKTTIPYPVDLALDASDNAYVLYANAVSGSTASSGVQQFNAAGGLAFSGALNTALHYPTQIATDTAGHIFVTNNDPNTATNGAIFQADEIDGGLAKVAALDNASGVAVDLNNDVWASAANSSDNSIVEYGNSTLTASTGTASPVLHSSSLGIPISSLAIDANQYVWGVSNATSGKSSAAIFANAGYTNYTLVGQTAYADWVSDTQQLTTYGGSGVALNSASVAFFPVRDALNAATTSVTGGIGLLGLTLQNASVAISGPTTDGSTTAVAPSRTEADGLGNIFWTDGATNGLLYMYTPATTDANGNAVSAVLTSLLPCYVYNSSTGYVCATSTGSSSFVPSKLRGLSIDSSGDLWMAADQAYGGVIEVLGLAAPAWPQLSYGRPGVRPQ